MTSEITVHDAAAGQLDGLVDRLKRNEKLIAALAPKIQKHCMCLVDGKRYVRVSGAQAIAQALGYGFAVSDVEITEVPDGHGGTLTQYSATASLIDAQTGTVIASAPAVIGSDEKWINSPHYTRVSMAQTRAVAKVGRINFGALYLELGADSDTPAEEMEDLPRRSVQSNSKALPPMRVTPPVEKTEDEQGCTFVGVVAAISEKKTTQGKTRYGIKMGDDWINTFAAQDVAIAKRSKENGIEVQIDAARNGRWLDLTSIAIIHKPASKAEPEAEEANDGPDAGDLLAAAPW